MRRRDFLPTLVAAAAVPGSQAAPVRRKGRLKQCVTKNVFGDLDLETSCREAARLGAYGYDLAAPADWPTVKKHGLICTMYPSGPGGNAVDGIGNLDLQPRFEKLLHAAIDEAAANGVLNIAIFTGARKGATYQQGADNCVTFFNRMKSHAEEKRITLCMENVNSRDRKDYFFDRMAWGVDVVTRVNSPRVKILYDIYHGQIMDGDVVQKIRDHTASIGHVHVAGVPGRHEIDNTQELNYRFIARALADAGFQGYVAHEYIPTPGRDPLASLRQAMEIFDV